MGSFLEEYGKVVIVIIVVAALVALGAYFSKDGRNLTKNTYDAFGDVTLTTTNDAVVEIGESGKNN